MQKSFWAGEVTDDETVLQVVREQSLVKMFKLGWNLTGQSNTEFETGFDA